jgi:hypothetical protein
VESELALAGASERADDLVEGEQLGSAVGAQAPRVSQFPAAGRRCVGRGGTRR